MSQPPSINGVQKPSLDIALTHNFFMLPLRLAVVASPVCIGAVLNHALSTARGN